MSAILLSVDYIPNISNNWPKGFSGYICGTIPSPSASCASPNLANIDTDAPQTFSRCCNGPLTNITSPITSPSDPSYGVSCLSYCPVDFARTIDNGTGIGFGDYWDCLSNRTTGWERGEDVVGQVTCGWVNTSSHEQCVRSVSVEQSYYSLSTASAATNGTAQATATASKTWKSCPAEITASATSTPSSTASGSKSDARLARGEVGTYSIGMGLLVFAFGVLLCA